MGIHDQAGHLVGLVGDDVLVEKSVQRQVCQHPRGGRAFCVVLGGTPGELVARAQRGGLGHHLHESVEGVVDAGDLLPVDHLSSLSARASMANSSSGELATNWWRLYTAK